MINLLPQDYQALQDSNYRFRQLAVVCAFAFALSLVSLVFFVPAHVFTNVRADTVAVENESVISAGPAEQNIFDTLSALSNAARLAEEFNSKLPVSNLYVTLHALELKPAAIHIDEIIYTNKIAGAGADATANGATISFRGLATTRDDLKTFAEFLSRQPEFDNIDLPISNFTKERNIDFSLSVTVINVPPKVPQNNS